MTGRRLRGAPGGAEENQGGITAWERLVPAWRRDGAESA